MADRPTKLPGLFSSLLQLGQALRDFVRALEGKAPLHGFDAVPHHNEATPQLALPSGEAHSEAAQLLTQQIPGWHTPAPSTLPIPTYAPAMTAFGIVFIALGAVTVWPLSIVGGLIFVLAVAKWIGELLP